MGNSNKIIMFGDSITKGLVPYFAREWKDKYSSHKVEIINAGVGGETSRDGLKRLDSVLYHEPQVVVVGFGMNDWRKGVSLAEFKKNLSEMIDAFENIDTRVIPVTINPDYQGLFKGTTPALEQCNKIIRDLAAEKRLKIADVNSLWKRKIKPVQKGLRDKIHPNELGYEIYCESLLNIVPREHTVILWQYNGRECHCNYKCPYCYYASAPKTKDYFWGNIDDWHAAFKNCFGKQKLIFYLAFGEPTIGKHFYDVVNMIEKEPKWSLRITTNLSQDLEKLVDSTLAKEGRLFINASFHPLQTKIESFIRQLLVLRKYNIESPVIYVMWPPLLKQFQADFEVFNRYNFLVHIRAFKGNYKGKKYPEAYTDEERQFIAGYCDDGTIKYMLNRKKFFDRHTYSGLHFFIVDCTGNIGYDSNCFDFHSKYRTIFGNIIQDYSLQFPMEPTLYPSHCNQGTVDGVSNYPEAGYRQLEKNNVLSFARQGGVYHDGSSVHYKHMKTDFNDSRIRAEYYFPSRNFKDEYYILEQMGLFPYMKFFFKRLKRKFF
jgi:acyl-CoA thioesterase-1